MKPADKLRFNLRQIELDGAVRARFGRLQAPTTVQPDYAAELRQRVLRRRQRRVIDVTVYLVVAVGLLAMAWGLGWR